MTRERIHLDLRSLYSSPLTGSGILPVKRNHRRAVPMAGCARNYVLLPFDFGRRQLSGDAAITGIRLLFDGSGLGLRNTTME